MRRRLPREPNRQSKRTSEFLSKRRVWNQMQPFSWKRRLMEIEPAAIPEHTCPPVIDLQTADTKQLEPISTVATT